jgi:hypothetical protein
MYRLFILAMVFCMSFGACHSDLTLETQMHLNLALTDPALFDEIDTILLLPFPSSSPEDCAVLEEEDVSYSHLMETISELPFIALPKLHTDMDGEHPETIEGPYFRYVFGDLPNGNLSLMTLGSKVMLSDEEKALGYLSVQSDQNESFLGRFPYDSIIARSCIVTRIVEGVDTTVDIALVPHSYSTEPGPNLDGGL